MKKLNKTNSFNQVAAYGGDDCSCGCRCLCALSSLDNASITNNAMSNIMSSTSKRNKE